MTCHWFKGPSTVDNCDMEFGSEGPVVPLRAGPPASLCTWRLCNGLQGIAVTICLHSRVLIMSGLLGYLLVLHAMALQLVHCWC